MDSATWFFSSLLEAHTYEPFNHKEISPERPPDEAGPYLRAAAPFRSAANLLVAQAKVKLVLNSRGGAIPQL